MANLFDKIALGHGEAMYTPEGIYNVSPSRLSYHIDANADFANRISDQLKDVPGIGGGLSLGFDILAPAASVVPSIGYDARQAYRRMEPGSGLGGWWDAFKAEDPEISIPGRMAGVLSPLASRFGYEVTGSGFKSLEDKRFIQQQLMNRRKQDMQQRIRQAEAAEKAKADAAAKAKADAAAAAAAKIKVSSGGYQGGDGGRGRGGQGAFKEDTRSMRSAGRSYTDARGNTGYSRGRKDGGRVDKALTGRSRDI